MRFFPSSTEHRGRVRALPLVLTLALTASALGLSGPVAHADDDLKKQQKQVQGQIADASKDLDHSSAAARKTAKALARAKKDLVAAQAELTTAQAQADAAKVKDDQMKAELAAAQQRLTEANQDLADGKASLADQKQQVQSVMTTIYQQGDPRLRAFSSLLSARTPADWARASAVQDVAVQMETSSYDKLRASKVLLQVKRKQVAEAKAAVEVAQAATAAHLTEMEAIERSKQSATTLVASRVNGQKAAQAAADAAVAADQATLAKLKAESAKISEKLRRQALRAGASSTAPSASNSAGILAYPVANPRVTSPYGVRTHPIYGYVSLHDGTDFGVACGSPMYATEDGVIEASYWSDVYGNRMVLNHGILKGVGVASIYNHATRYVVGVGQRVKRGQLVGYSGTTGWSTGCHLHFTVLVNGSSVNPMNWF